MRTDEAPKAVKAVRSVIMEPGCIVCGLCESLAPAVFEVLDDGAGREAGFARGHQERF